MSRRKVLFGCAAALTFCSCMLPGAQDEDIGSASDAIVLSSCDEGAIRAASSPASLVFIDRALDWVHRAVPYCQCVTGAGGDYRTDCSGLVSMAWGLPAPGNTTYSFAGGVWDNGRSVRLGSFDDLEIGDATNYPGVPDVHGGHIRLFAGWLNSTHTRYCTIEEYSTGHPAEIRAHDLDRSIYIPVRKTGWTPCTASAEVCDGADNDCDGAVDEEDVCERAMLSRTIDVYAPPSTTDVDGDGHADVCARSPSGWECRSSDGRTFVGPEISDANGWTRPEYYETIRMGDVDGDGRADFCARASDLFWCWPAEGDGFGAAFSGPALSDAEGWNQPQYYTTIRLLDFDGDGRDDVCARGAAGMTCWRSTGRGFGDPIDGPEWSDAQGFGSARYYGTIRAGDVDGDGQGDLCVRHSEGVDCWLSDGQGFPQRVIGPRWSDANGWGAPMYWGTLVLVDFDGDGLDDLCARASDGIYCAASEGTTFADAVLAIGYSNDTGWADPTNYETMRVGDLDGDGASELCLRADAGIRCVRWNGSSFDSIEGPAWSDASSWSLAQYYSTLALGDMDGDGADELCARASDGYYCASLSGGSFASAHPMVADDYRDADGWAQPQYYSTLRMGGRRGRAEPLPMPTPMPTPMPRDRPSHGLAGGCSTSGGPSGGALWTLLVLGLLVRRRLSGSSARARRSR